ncbi:DUF2163 domain-containing protein [Kaistia dalseonensis]|uniref:Phage protein (TIGR02218 family) n=1 Tax=Kaistia dalseonensis TaxID=410840 RepID=A0ABU0GZZ6_9HYPH|nr:DUF2163 domain-containing protein [Kaistia dalseonensis]MCX5493084.1 DUF2163 domain-containing protein [Kaistia dalseonensis]MDQ0435639.1 putative phage protein (TIGR02218 family) [Kaistia dalseonensis]
MRTLSEGLAAHLAGETTMLCHCWRVTRKDGTALGFTDHDRDLVLDGTTFEAATGFAASEATAEAGFATGGMEVAGALVSDRLSEDELAAGTYDHARIETFLVNWSDVGERLLLRVGHVGEVVREDGAFRVEIRGLMAALDAPRGRSFRAACDADLGDQRCGVDLGPFTVSAIVLAAEGGRRMTVSGLDGFAAGWFERGTVRWLSGANAGRGGVVKTHRLVEGVVTVEFWTAMSGAIAAGDAFEIVAGCDKRFATCREKFANTLNFRGFPHMPGNDFSLGYARSGGDNDGGPVVV